MLLLLFGLILNVRISQDLSIRLALEMPLAMVQGRGGCFVVIIFVVIIPYYAKGKAKSFDVSIKNYLLKVCSGVR